MICVDSRDPCGATLLAAIPFATIGACSLTLPRGLTGANLLVGLGLLGVATLLAVWGSAPNPAGATDATTLHIRGLSDKRRVAT